MQGREHRFNAPWKAFVPIFEHFFHHLALQIGLRAAQIARDDGELAQSSKAHQVFFFHIGQRANDDVFAIVRHQFRRHGFELATEEHVQKQRFQNVVAVVAQGDFATAQFFGHAV